MVTDEVRAKVADAVESHSQLMMDLYGGYPDDWQIANVDGVDCVIIASRDHDGGPDLNIVPVEKFVAEHEEALAEMEEAE